METKVLNDGQKEGEEVGFGENRVPETVFSMGNEPSIREDLWQQDEYSYNGRKKNEVK